MEPIKKNVAIIVAHPDDETLWAGGTILNNKDWNCFIISLCRGKDEDRSPKFIRTLSILNAEGKMGDLDDGPEQLPQKANDVEQTIVNLLPSRNFDIIITHNPKGEYTRHRRHEETGVAVINLWFKGQIHTNELWVFAYEDNNKTKYPEPVKDADCYNILPNDVWQKKYKIITETYGFDTGGFEALTTPRAESFWQFTDAGTAHDWLKRLINS
jgi:LmbE family N-acetylglucosaminyl deacetylase